MRFVTQGEHWSENLIVNTQQRALCSLPCSNLVSMASVSKRFGLRLLEKQRNILEKNKIVYGAGEKHTLMCV